MKILILDNYDSFVYNLVHLVREEGVDHDVIRNDKIEADAGMNYDAIILSPGPGIPDEAGNMKSMIKACANHRPILGVCLGHQALAECYGGRLKNLEQVVHGQVTSVTQCSENQLFDGLDSEFEVGRYHSWVVDENALPSDFSITAKDANGQIMAMEHASLPIHGVQFHPESVMTPDGAQILRNFLSIVKTSAS